MAKTTTTLCYVITTFCAVGIFATVTPSAQYNLPSEDTTRGRQLFFVPQSAPQFQRFEDSSASQYFQPKQQIQDVQTLPVNNGDKAHREGAPAKLETLEPDAELIPGAQQVPQGPPAQVPASPPSGIPGLLPGQRVYIVHPQHQIYMNALYPGLTNGFRPDVQFPGYQRFYIVQAQPTVGDGRFSPQAGYQNAILFDPAGQPVASPQYIQPNFQRLVVQTPQHGSRLEPVQNYGSRINTDLSKNYAEPIKSQEQKNFIDQNRNVEQVQSNPEQNRYLDQYRAYQQSANLVDSQPQLSPNGYSRSPNAFAGAQNGFAGAPNGFAGAPNAALPFFGFGRQVEFPYQGLRGDLQLNPNAVQFSQLVSLHSGQYPGVPAGLADTLPSPSAPPAPEQAQGRNDYSYEESKEDTSISTEPKNLDQSSNKDEEKSSESAEVGKTEDDSKEITQTDKTTALSHSVANNSKRQK